jgi:CubicO group peptidase (beta-lactamase class C family)
MAAAYNAHDFNGVVLVARNDSILLEKGYGWRDYDHRIPLDSNSIFPVGSITKTFTATIILYLQEHHKLDIHENLVKYFPGYKYADKITIENLLNNTSGLFELSLDPLYHSDRPFSQNDFWAIMNDKPLDPASNSKFENSNSNYLLLGYLIEKVTGKTYEQNVREIIFDKAGIKQSGFNFEELMDKNKTVGYHITNDTIRNTSAVYNSTATYSAGSLYTTAGDLYLWYKALLSNLIIGKKSFDEAVTPYNEAYGYGWQVTMAYNKIQWEHNGGIGGFTSSFRILPDDNACVIILRNEDIYPSVVSVGIFSILYNIPNYYIPRFAIRSNKLDLQQYTGQYKLESPKDFQVIVSIKNGRLISTAIPGDYTDTLYEEKKNSFFVKGYNCQFVFNRNERDEIVGFNGYLGNQLFVYKKIK